METSPNPRHRRLLAPYAGTLEKADCEGFEGWCFDQRRPGRGLILEIFVGPLLAGEARCSAERADLSQIVGEPCTAGFVFRWDSCADPVRAELLSVLRKSPSDSPAPVRVRVKGSFAWLSQSHLNHLGQSFPACSVLAAYLTRLEEAHQASAASKKASAQALTQLRQRQSELPADSGVKAIAFYLPQFHPIPENDLWWGKGFTEWRNVAQAQPLFDGHRQPRVPADLGYYDLRLPEIREAQADLARRHGIHGFCYYYYWFAGKRLLERPLDEMLESGSPDFPFCLCWANESWSRRWDGSELDVLMQQKHSPELDLAFAQSVVPYFRDPRYIRVGDKPMLVIYRPDIIPDLPETIERWRAHFRNAGIGEVHLVAALSFGYERGQEAGFDAEVQFPPHGLSLPERSPQYGVAPDFGGKIVHYDDVARALIGSVTPGKKRYFTVMLDWDNTARKKNGAHVFHGFSLDSYERLLRASVLKTEQLYPENERFVFINAWNEWAEGTYLEPDSRFGLGPLERTRAAVQGTGPANQDLLDELLRILPEVSSRRMLDLAATVIEERQRAAGDDSTAMLELDRPHAQLVVEKIEYTGQERSLLWIESVAPHAKLDGNRLPLSGWIISRAGACETVEVLVDDIVVAQCRVVQTRADVYDHHRDFNAVGGPNAFSVVLDEADLMPAVRSTGVPRLAVRLRALGANVTVLAEATVTIKMHDMASTLQLLVDQQLIDAGYVERLRGFANDSKSHLFVIHDPYPAGAQIFMLRFLRWLKAADARFPFEVLFAIRRADVAQFGSKAAEIVADFSALAQVHFLDASHVPENQNALARDAYRLIYLNSIASIRNLRGLPASHAPMIVHVHELHSTVELLLGDEAADLALVPARFVACSDAVARMLVDDLEVPRSQVSTVHAFVPERPAVSPAQAADSEAMDTPKRVIVLVAGSINWRKGAYVLGPVAQRLSRLGGPPVTFVWVGDRGEDESAHRLKHEFKQLGLSDWLELAGRRDDIERYYAAADIFLLPSLEDPFPLVMLEAAMARLPVVAFEGAGGASEFIANGGGGIAVPYLDVDAMAQALHQLTADPEMRGVLGLKAYASVQNYSEAALAPRLLQVILRERAGRPAAPESTIQARSPEAPLPLEQDA